MSPRKKLFFIVATFVVLLCAAYAEYYFYFSKHAAPVVVSTDVDSVKTPIVAQKRFNISYSYATTTVFGNDEQGGITYLTILGLASTTIQESVNESLKEVLTSSCFGDPVDKKSLEDIRNLYKDAADNPSHLKTSKEKALVDTLSYEAVRQKIIKDFDFYDSTEMEVLYANNSVLSVKVHNNNDCGGVHPNYETYELTFNLLTGEQVSFDTFFKNFKQDKKKIEAIIFPYLQSENAKSDGGECDYEDDYKSGQLDLSDLTRATLSEDGIVFVSLGYSHAQASCEPEPAITVPFSLLMPYLNRDVPFMQSVVHKK